MVKVHTSSLKIKSSPNRDKGAKKVQRKPQPTVGKRGQTPLKIKSGKRSQLGTSGIVDDVLGGISGVVDVVKSVGTAVTTGNILPLMNVPNSILKVVDSAKNVVNDLSGKTMPSAPKVTLDKTQEITSQNERVVEELKKTMPVITTTSVPSAYNSNVSYPTPVSKQTVEKGQVLTNLSGSFTFLTTQFPFLAGGATFQKGIVLGTAAPVAGFVMPSLTNGGIFGPRAYEFAQLFQRWRLNQLSFTYLNTCGANQVGNIYAIINNSTDVQSLLNITDVGTFSQYENKLQGSAGQIATRGILPKGIWQFLQPPTGNDNGIKWFAQWCWCVYSSGFNGPDGTTVLPCGQWIATYDIDFAQATPQSTYLQALCRRDLFQLWMTHSKGMSDFLPFVRCFYNYLASYRGETKLMSGLTVHENDFVLKALALRLYEGKGKDYSRGMLQANDIHGMLDMLYMRYRPFLRLILDDSVQDFVELVKRFVKDMLDADQMATFDFLVEEDYEEIIEDYVE